MNSDLERLLRGGGTADDIVALADSLHTETAEECGSAPPDFIIDGQGRTWKSGDCWCTLPAEHPDTLCMCGPCTERHGAPGWAKTC